MFPQDSWITSYRCHAVMLARGGTVEAIAAELFGFKDGVSDGKGGSMHLYSKENNFYGGAGIVGAQIPAGVGLAFANKYNAGNKPPYNVAIGGYGDGAANQGQIWEVANIAALWKLPMIFLCENNQYGMGTSVERHSCNPDYYTQGNVIPGVWVDGMDVLSMRSAVSYCRDHCSSGKGPIFLEASTYRYHGHSMSDPGITYRDRDEVSNTRSTRDPIECLKNHLITAGFATAAELKLKEKEVRKEVAGQMKKAKESSLPADGNLYTNIFSSGQRDGTKEIDEVQPYIRTVDLDDSHKGPTQQY
jgi:pyruvate dehydrogenase E1 component alpha subunit